MIDRLQQGGDGKPTGQIGFSYVFIGLKCCHCYIVVEKTRQHQWVDSFFLYLRLKLSSSQPSYIYRILNKYCSNLHLVYIYDQTRSALFLVYKFDWVGVFEKPMVMNPETLSSSYHGNTKKTVDDISFVIYIVITVCLIDMYNNGSVYENRLLVEHIPLLEFVGTFLFLECGTT